MQKAPSHDTFRQTKTCTSLAESRTKSNQLVLLEYYIKSRDLTSAVTLLEMAGFSDEVALFVLAHAQTALEVGE